MTLLDYSSIISRFQSFPNSSIIFQAFPKHTTPQQTPIPNRRLLRFSAAKTNNCVGANLCKFGINHGLLQPCTARCCCRKHLHTIAFVALKCLMYLTRKSMEMTNETAQFSHLFEFMGEKVVSRKTHAVHVSRGFFK